MEELGVRHTCGHVVTYTITDDRTTEGRSVEELEAQGCWECRKARFIAEKQAQVERLQQAGASAGLPQLRGTPKQVAWAMTIRERMLGEAVAFLRNPSGRFDDGYMPDDEGLVVQALQCLMEASNAEWWIGQKGVDGAFAIRNSCEAIQAARAIAEARAAGSPVIHYYDLEFDRPILVYARRLKNGMWALAGLHGYLDANNRSRSLSNGVIDLTGPHATSEAALARCDDVAGRRGFYGPIAIVE
jgi:hypothetical protein